MTSTLRRRAAEGCLSRRERKATKEMLNLKGEIGSVIARVKDVNLDRNDAAAMIRGYRALKASSRSNAARRSRRSQRAAWRN
jgi:hypothetical protein